MDGDRGLLGDGHTTMTTAPPARAGWGRAALAPGWPRARARATLARARPRSRRARARSVLALRPRRARAARARCCRRATLALRSRCDRTVAESEEDIADVSRSVTSHCVQEALERAAKDAAYVRRVVAQDLCQQASNMQLGRSLHNPSPPVADLPRLPRTTTDTTSFTQASPNPWSVASTAPPTTTNTALLNQIASNASMAMSNKNKMSSSTTTLPMPTTPALPSATTYLSQRPSSYVDEKRERENEQATYI